MLQRNYAKVINSDIILTTKVALNSDLRVIALYLRALTIHKQKIDMKEEDVHKIIENYRLQAEQSHLISEQKAFRYRNFANFLETNIDFLEEATTENDLWDIYNEQSDEGFEMLNPDEEDY